MSIQIMNDHVIRVTELSDNFPEEIIHQNQTYIYGTTVEKSEAVYYLKSWFYS